jgi:hypothetical protein
MLLVREMLDAGIISRQDYLQIEKMYITRYKPVFQNQMVSFLKPIMPDNACN